MNVIVVDAVVPFNTDDETDKPTAKDGEAWADSQVNIFNKNNSQAQLTSLSIDFRLVSACINFELKPSFSFFITVKLLYNKYLSVPKFNKQSISIFKFKT